MLTHMNKTLFEVAAPTHFHQVIRRLEGIAEKIESQEAVFLRADNKFNDKFDQIET